jgi:hypothetical protein
MAVTYEDVNPTLIANTTMQKIFRDGVWHGYYIAPNDGYVLHDKENDWTDIDPITGEEVLYLGYSSGRVSCGTSYDFAANPREFYAVLETDVPADQIFGLPDNEHEVM